jgi:hypothetical protein
MSILMSDVAIRGSVPRTCAECPFSRPLGGDRLVCQCHLTASDVVRGHWTPSTDCFVAFNRGGF